MIHSRRRVGPVLIGAVLVAVAVGAALLRSAGGGDPGAEGQPAYPALESLRAAVAECTEGLAEEEARFRAHGRAVDSLRAAVFAHESADRTVPAEEFDAYLEVFGAYNESVAEWHERAAALESSWEACRALAERHNALVDSLSIAPRDESVVGAGGR
jgi:hypothetical protein